MPLLAQLSAVSCGVLLSNWKKSELLFLSWKKKSALKVLEHFEREESAVIANYCCLLVMLMDMLLKPVTATQKSHRPVIIHLRV